MPNAKTRTKAAPGFDAEKFLARQSKFAVGMELLNGLLTAAAGLAGEIADAHPAGCACGDNHVCRDVAGDLAAVRHALPVLAGSLASYGPGGTTAGRLTGDVARDLAGHLGALAGRYAGR